MTKWPEKKDDYNCDKSYEFVLGFNEAYDLCRAAHDEKVQELRESLDECIELLRLQEEHGRPVISGSVRLRAKQALSRLTEEER